MGVAGMRVVSGVAACLLGAAMGQASAYAATEPVQGSPAAIGLQPGGEAPQAKDELLAGTDKFAEHASNVTDVNLDRNMLGAIRGKDKYAANKLNFIVVHSYEYDKPGMYDMDEVEAYQRKLTHGDWNCFIHVRERKSGESTDICKRDTAGDNHELVIITAEPKELTFVHLSGKMPLSDLGSLGQLGSLGMLMAIPPVPPVPPVPSVPAVPSVPPVPPVAASPKAQKQQEGFIILQRELEKVQELTMKIEPALRIYAQQECEAQLQSHRAWLESPEFKQQMEAMQKQLRDLKIPEMQLDMQQLASAETQEQIAELQSPEFRLQMENQMRELEKQMKDQQRFDLQIHPEVRLEISPEVRLQMLNQMKEMKQQIRNIHLPSQQEMQKQMQDLQKQLQDLKNSPAMAPSPR